MSGEAGVEGRNASEQDMTIAEIFATFRRGQRVRARNLALAVHDDTCIECHNVDMRNRCTQRRRLLFLGLKDRGGVRTGTRTTRKKRGISITASWFHTLAANGLSQTEIARMLGVSRQRISQLVTQFDVAALKGRRKPNPLCSSCGKELALYQKRKTSLCAVCLQSQQKAERRRKYTRSCPDCGQVKLLSTNNFNRQKSMYCMRCAVKPGRRVWPSSKKAKDASTTR